MEYVWNMHGICMEYVCILHGICMEYAWNNMECVWNMYAICMDYVWNMYVNLYEMSGICAAFMEHVWNHTVSPDRCRRTASRDPTHEILGDPCPDAAVQIIWFYQGDYYGPFLFRNRVIQNGGSRNSEIEQNVLVIDLFVNVLFVRFPL